MSKTTPDERNMQRAQNKLAALYGRLQTIYDCISGIDEDPIKIDNFLSECFTIDTLRNDFIAAIEERNNLMLTSEKDVVPSYSSLTAFEQLYSKCKYKAHQLSEKSQITHNKSCDERVRRERSSLHLPRLELCSFNGDNESWPIFYETFKSAIHENTDLTNGEKIQYLIGKLKGKALDMCQGILPTSENYNIIWNALITKYNDKRLLAATYMDRLINLPTVKDNSPREVEEFIDKFSSIYFALKQLDLDSMEDFLFIHIGLKRVGLETVKSFELKYKDFNNFPKCPEFINFVRGQSHILQRAHNVASANTSVNTQGSTQVRKNNVDSSVSQSRSRFSNNLKTFISVQESNNCLCCGRSDHSQVSKCSNFLSMIPNDRFKFIKNNKLCVNCLNSTHTILNCKDSRRCKECQKPHHSLLHFPNSRIVAGNVAGHSNKMTATINTGDPRPPVSTESGPAVSLCAVGECTLGSQLCVGARDSSVLLGTALCHVVDAVGNVFMLRALVDSASQKDLITTECCKRLNLKLYAPQSKYVSGVGDVSNPIEGTTCLTIRSHIDDSVRFTIQPVVVNRITNELPTARVDNARLDYLNNLPLADYNYYTPAGIDLIIGSDLFARILCPNTISRATGEPVAIQTLLGYIIVGQASVIDPVCNIVRSYVTISDTSFENGLNRFFELEEVPNVPTYLSKDEQMCEKYYCDTTRRDSDGRFIVSLPFKGDTSALGDSMHSAERRYLSLERKLLANPNMKIEYDKVFAEYLQKNYMRPIGTISQVGYNNDQYVIPHHGVVRQDKSTTKLRVVLDASNPTSTGKALNDLLYTGPNLQNNLFEIILKFRLLPVALSADIRQMYLRILVDDKDTKFQRLLYRFSPTEPIMVFEITRVPFGLCCSPYLAIRTVRQLISEERQRYPAAATVAEADVYTDDLATSCSSVTEAIELSNQLIQLFATADFELVKFSSNSPEVMAGIPASHRISEAVEFSADNQLKVLGLHWLPADDVFTFSVNAQPQECTKRKILSTIARLWDVMGFVAPVTLLSKLIIKSLWENNVGWDECPPANIVSLWKRIESELHLLQQIKLTRHIGVHNECTVSIVGFADASERAYGGVVYLHVYLRNENRSVMNLICSKSRVAPSRTVISLARLELCANLLLAKLVRIVISTYSARCHIANILAFTDSTVALAWINSCPSRWQTFVANRVAKIQSDLDPSHFHHISGKENPADCLSRGLTPAQLIEHPLWFTGPPFAHLPIDEWPIQRFNINSVDVEIPEVKVNVLATTTAAPPTLPVLCELASRVSSWPKLLRIVVYICRFIKKLPREFKISHLDTAEELVVKDLQHLHFYNEIKTAQNGGKLPPAFLKLNVFLKDGILRVGGRLSNADIDYNSRHPFLLPRKDHIVNLIIDYYHKKYLHTGPQLLMSLLRQKFWILSARNIVRKRVQQCHVCFKANPKNTAPMMADLPACRVNVAKAFCHTGVDYAGPLSIVPYRRRGVHSRKAYLCLFICLVTKAVHIELASDLSTDSFLNALKRFISRRGPVSVLYSDNGTNFIGAKAYLNEMYQLLESEQYKDKFANELRDNRIEWKFNPASAPHFGGIWEGNIRIVKNHLTRIVGSQLLTFEEMITVLTQIEAILNSRPLSVLSSDPSEPLALTPAHFLVMTPLKSLPSEDLTDDRGTLLQRKRIVDRLVKSFWNRWKVEYLNTMQVRNKWLTPATPVQQGTVVLLKSDNSAPLDWPLGVIERTFPGKDGVHRVVDVRTKSGIYRRPVVKVFPLPNQ